MCTAVRGFVAKRSDVGQGRRGQWSEGQLCGRLVPKNQHGSLQQRFRDTVEEQLHLLRNFSGQEVAVDDGEAVPREESRDGGLAGCNAAAQTNYKHLAASMDMCRQIMLLCADRGKKAQGRIANRPRRLEQLRSVSCGSLVKHLRTP